MVLSLKKKVLQMDRFVLARETQSKGGKTSLPGVPIAIVKSEAPALAGTFLCVVTESLGARSAKDSEAAEKATLAAAREARKALQYAGGKDGSAIRALHAGVAGPRRPGAGVDPDGSFFGPTDPASSVAARRRQFADRVDERSAQPWRLGPDTEEDDPDESDDEDSAPQPGKPPAAKLPPVPESPVLALTDTTFVKLPPNSWFEPLPLVKPEDRQAKDAYRTTMYVAGRSGSGKSFWSAGVIQRYKKLWPSHTIWGICKTKMEDDPAYSGLGVKQLPLAKLREYAADQKAKASRNGGGASGGGADGEIIDIREAFGSDGCLIIFDDWDSFEKEDKAFVLAVIKDVQNLGRKLRISCIVTSHQLTNYMETRGIISEAEYITVFPQHTMPQQLTYLCNKLGIPKDVISTLRKKGRWSMLHNAAPLYLLSDSECELLTAGHADRGPSTDETRTAELHASVASGKRRREEPVRISDSEDEAAYSGGAYSNSKKQVYARRHQ
jgi:hypothetical protein